MATGRSTFHRLIDECMADIRDRHQQFLYSNSKLSIDGYCRYLERMGLIHRDVKRENLFVVPYVREDGGRGDRAVIGDLGMMQAASQVPSLAGGGSGTRGFGTTEYLPPETLKPVVAEALRAPQFDWWAFGAVIYELLHAGVTEDNSWWQVMQPEGSDEPPLKVMRANYTIFQIK